MTTFIAILATLAAAGDDVELVSGGILSGTVEERGDQVFVHTPQGSVGIPRAQVAVITRRRQAEKAAFDAHVRGTNFARIDEVEDLLSWARHLKVVDEARDVLNRVVRMKEARLDRSDPAQLDAHAAWAVEQGAAEVAARASRDAFELRRRALPAGDANARYALGLRARKAGLGVDALVLFQEAITLDPDHAGARESLGYRRIDGRWMTDAEANRAQGLVEFEGQWTTPIARDTTLALRAMGREREEIDRRRDQLSDERARLHREQEGLREELRGEMEGLRREVAARPAVVHIEQHIVLPPRRPVFVDPHCPPPVRPDQIPYGCLRADCRLRGPHAH